MTTNTTETFTKETLVRSFARRAAAIRIRHGMTKRSADMIEGLAEGLCILKAINAPMGFILPFREAWDSAGPMPRRERQDWIDGIVDATLAGLI